MIQLSDFNYKLPPELIAHSPIFPRDQSKLLVVDRKSKNISHHHFYELPNFLNSGDILVRNNTKVIPVKLVGSKPTGGKVEILLVKKDTSFAKEVWECLTKPGVSVGKSIYFSLKSSENKVIGTCIKAEGYSRWFEFTGFNSPFLTVLEQIGATPIPPYIHSDKSEDELRELYQTIFAKVKGSAAAPTAGLHFTPELDTKLNQKGIEILDVTLHVGLGTFSPVREQNITKHQMHSEWYELSDQVSSKINQAKQKGCKIISVGTTTTRVLETCSIQTLKDDSKQFSLIPNTGDTSIFIYPPYQFRSIDGLITNFHLPESTLLMLISAFASKPNTDLDFINFSQSLVGKAYQHAIKNHYRFFSFGDAMLII